MGGGRGAEGGAGGDRWEVIKSGPNGGNRRRLQTATEKGGGGPLQEKGKHLILLLMPPPPNRARLIRLGPRVRYRIIPKVRGVLQTDQSPRLRRRGGGPAERRSIQRPRNRGGELDGGGGRKIMASAAGREVGEEAEIELLARGTQYAGREAFTSLPAR